MRIIKTRIKDLLIIKKKTFKDKRGFLRELFKEKTFLNKFVFEILSNSKKNVLRGLHLQRDKPQEKYVTVLSGKAFDVAVDLRKNSKTFGQHFSTILSANQNISFYIPKGFAHGFCGLEKENYIIYSCSNYRDAKNEIGIKYNDKNLKIKWPTKKPIVSKKDKKNISFEEFKKINKW